MTTNHTAPELLEAVGVDWREKYGSDTAPSYELGGDNTAYFAASDEIKYTGPEIGTPELDALLLVAWQRWLQNVTHSGKRDIAKNLHYDSFEENSGGWISGRLGLMFQAPFPGHALARAILEVNHA